MYMGGVKLSAADKEMYKNKLKDMPKYIEMMRSLTKQINGNFESLSLNHSTAYENLVRNFPLKFAGDMMFRM
jgi:hypothetical protein